MEVDIPEEFLGNYRDEAIEIVKELDTRRLAGEDITEDYIQSRVRYYFEKRDMKIIEGETPFDCCYAFVLHELGFGHLTGLRNKPPGYFLDLVKENFDEIGSYDDISNKDLIVYYFQPEKYLHMGLVVLNDGKIRAVSQWGNQNLITHPLERIDRSYGNKYNLFRKR